MNPNPNNQQIHFDQNWNCKLFCNVFTTLRPRDDNKFIVGNTMDVFKKGVFMGDVEVMQIVNIKNIDSITEGMALLDTGYSKQETIEIIETLYLGIIPNIREVEFSYIILRRITQDYQHNNQKNEVTAFQTLNISA